MKISSRSTILASLVLALLLPFTPACGPDPEGGDGGVDDSGSIDGGDTDGGVADGGLVDGGVTDGGTDGGATDGGGGPTALTFTELQSQIFSARCASAGCHGGGNSPTLSGGGVYAGLVGVATGELPSMSYIEPGFPADSYLYRKVEGTQGSACTDAGLSAAVCGVQMPRNQTPLTAAQLEGLRLWIEEGALDN
ncbi:MAG: hypothetical protein P1V51_14200 [Deltaproteobacteria bacterium]|nr:hypothetical protein [Deltaproteobacteria bacterium]